MKLQTQNNILENVPDEVLGQLLWTMDKIKENVVMAIRSNEEEGKKLIEIYLDTSKGKKWLTKLIEFTRARDHFSRLTYDAIDIALKYVDKEDVWSMYKALPWYLDQTALKRFSDDLDITVFEESSHWIQPDWKNVLIFLKISLWSILWEKSNWKNKIFS